MDAASTHATAVGAVSGRARRTFADPAGSGPAPLTDQEERVLELVSLGHTNAAIGRALQRSPRTIAKHLEHIYRKLGVSNRAAAVASSHGERPGPGHEPSMVTPRPPG
jgi:DNA-binding CsgD family transcriptional regulator